MTHLSLAKTAMDEPATASSVKRARERGRKWTLVVLVTIAAGMAVGYALSATSWSVLPFICSMVTAFVSLQVGLAFAYNAWQARRILRAYPWQALPCERVDSPGNYRIRVEMTGSGAELLLQSVAYSYPVALRGGDQPQAIWYAGPPTGKGVVSPVGGHLPYRVIVVRPLPGDVVPHQPHRPGYRATRQR
ncbi:hypothetical protein H9Y04_13335 [Streptomyces sp. TRM66268-LWL]|uniref:Uncharacterized protein n=1 Tax=Streptomyces polyasparticus TaxID=2767826 RepID=A0ABR7SDQ7_9ACTN|nr:hypothetical protein [Streptomyces polyasparticus]MBC9713553.1 hypothetical protein [Streptomyces polyasparticus]